jgi:hypothetical protein
MADFFEETLWLYTLSEILHVGCTGHGWWHGVHGPWVVAWGARAMGGGMGHGWWHGVHGPWVVAWGARAMGGGMGCTGHGWWHGVHRPWVVAWVMGGGITLLDVESVCGFESNVVHFILFSKGICTWRLHTY